MRVFMGKHMENTCETARLSSTPCLMTPDNHHKMEVEAALGIFFSSGTGDLPDMVFVSKGGDTAKTAETWWMGDLQDPKIEVRLVPYKAISWGCIPLHRPYIGLIYGRYLQFRFLKWPLTSWWIGPRDEFGFNSCWVFQLNGQWSRKKHQD